MGKRNDNPARSSWTVDTLKAHFDAVLSARKEYFDARLMGSEEDKKSALESLNKRLDLLNEFRGQAGDDAKRYAQSDVVDQQVDALQKRITTVENFQLVQAGQSKGIGSVAAVAMGVIGVLGTLVAIAMSVYAVLS
jgi:predicted DsbA family dithiol-disulfide isomerase